MPSSQCLTDSFCNHITKSRFFPAWLLAGIYIFIAMLTRIGLLIMNVKKVGFSFSALAIFPIGFISDLLMACVLVLPLSLFLAVVPLSILKSKIIYICLHVHNIIMTCFFIFCAVSTFVFWEEFECRFNFIAVDYLVYTNEVVDNIRQSYPMPLIFAGLAVGTALIYFFVRKKMWYPQWRNQESHGSIIKGLLAITALPILLVAYCYYAGVKSSKNTHAPLETLTAGLRHMESFYPSLGNNYQREIAKNSDYSFFAAFFSNELPWELYASLPADENAAIPEQALSNVKNEIIRDAPHATEEKKLNIIQITVESLSYEYLGHRGAPKYATMNLTPNLDRLANESLTFEHMYAVGTRTVRGMEALSMSIPPLPGQSLLRRANSENSFCLPNVLKHKGYDCSFIYGGSGFFDNMNHFFENNGCRIVDKPAKMEKDHPAIKFENAWGVCDEDLFSWCLTEADRSFATNQPFYQFVMTTSNHRPFTWPENTIDIPMGKTVGGVKYTDYAIGKFIEAARQKPWFKDTVFVIVADHCMSVAGKEDLVVRKYEIPCIIYSPAHITPQKFAKLCSQIDYAPTLLGIMNLNYDSKFFGSDVLNENYKNERAFISNYQKLGFLTKEADGQAKLRVLLPEKKIHKYNVQLDTGALQEEQGEKYDPTTVRAISYYSAADYIFHAEKYHFDP